MTQIMVLKLWLTGIISIVEVTVSRMMITQEDCIYHLSLQFRVQDELRWDTDLYSLLKGSPWTTFRRDWCKNIWSMMFVLKKTQGRRFVKYKIIFWTQWHTHTLLRWSGGQESAVQRCTKLSKYDYWRIFIYSDVFIQNKKMYVMCNTS